MKQRLEATVLVKFALDCRDKQGNLLKTIHVEKRLTPAEAAKLAAQAQGAPK